MAQVVAPKRAVFDSLVKLGRDATQTGQFELAATYADSVLRLAVELGLLRPDGSIPRK